MALTGMQRSLTVTINKTLAGEQVPGYPKIYQGRNAFIYNMTGYTAITADEMATIPTEAYLERLAAFQGFVALWESGLVFETDTVEGAEAYRENTTACPIGN